MIVTEFIPFIISFVIIMVPVEWNIPSSEKEFPKWRDFHENLNLCNQKINTSFPPYGLCMVPSQYTHGHLLSALAICTYLLRSSVEFPLSSSDIQLAPLHPLYILLCIGNKCVILLTEMNKTDERWTVQILHWNLRGIVRLQGNRQIRCADDIRKLSGTYTIEKSYMVCFKWGLLPNLPCSG